MADTKLSALGALTGADSASGDLFYVDDISATTSKSITRAELAIGMNATQAEVDAGTATNKLLPPSLNKISQLTLVATTSGTSHDFTIVAGTRLVEVMINGVSTNGTSPLLVQLGDSGGIETTGYQSRADRDGASGSSTAGFILNDVSNASSAYYGKLSLSLLDAATFAWVGEGHMIDNAAQNSSWGFGGGKATSAATTTVRITTVNGSDTFDAGSVNVNYIK